MQIQNSFFFFLNLILGWSAGITSWCRILDDRAINIHPLETAETAIHGSNETVLFDHVYFWHRNLAVATALRWFIGWHSRWRCVNYNIGTLFEYIQIWTQIKGNVLNGFIHLHKLLEIIMVTV